MYPKLQGYDLKQLKELVERNGWKNVQLSLDDIRTENESRPTKHAPDVVDSVASVSIPPASEVSASEANSTPATIGN